MITSKSNSKLHRTHELLRRLVDRARRGPYGVPGVVGWGLTPTADPRPSPAIRSGVGLKPDPERTNNDRATISCELELSLGKKWQVRRHPTQRQPCSAPEADRAD